MDNFWEAITGANVDLNWLLKVRSYFNKIEKEQKKIKCKKIFSHFRNASLKNVC